MKLLVTGGLGFIGSNFVRHTLAKSHKTRIVNLDIRTYAGNPENLKGMKGARRHQWIKGDIADPKVVDRAMKGVDAVVHFAAESHVDRSITDAGAFLRTNVLGTQVLLDAAKKHAVRRFVHVSTDEVYGSVATGASRENDRLLPNSPYAASKAASDLLVRSYFETHGMPVLVTRCSNNFGPYQFPEKALPVMITNWMDGEPFPLYGDGLNIRDWIHVEDHCRGIDLVLRKGKLGEIYNIGGTASLTNKQLVERVRRIMGVDASLVEHVTDRLGHDRRYAVNCSKIKRLGFKHSTTFDRALKATIEWYWDNQSWWRKLKGKTGYKSYYKKQYKGLAKR
ncbi:MAG: dTDP-glucose 4,6-dehydratase [Elusimicrobia bacterium]|nr:MAG: dTDP-glucose 4,6-dehydratase [Elusimicrobiota bacterium]